ncbi:hypothetical protein CEXT_423021 [Caerostris extrusa]|uniref:C2H2-type domain-containing protein n=1 Tax=Caerostris extrusa TaxID=172846 RepID=A0AAV4R8P8_CAEEX|nr:hypothetical protein CEXT_423021 [Caerostris extrusa]
MEITKCEFCNAYIANFEVHNCTKFGNQHRRTSATLPQSSYGNVAEDIELIIAEEMENEALWPFVRQSDSSTLNQINQPLNQINNSRQQSILPICIKQSSVKKKRQDVDAPQKPKYSFHKCSKCPIKFRRKDYLESHERVHNPEKPYVCNFCDKAFINTGRLITHIRAHTGEKPFSCDKCGKCFPDKDNWRVHLRTHTGEKPFACNKCNKRYSKNFDLKHHMHKHTEEERRKCYSCGEEFSSEESLRAHKCRKSK